VQRAVTLVRQHCNLADTENLVTARNFRDRTDPSDYEASWSLRADPLIDALRGRLQTLTAERDRKLVVKAVVDTLQTFLPFGRKNHLWAKGNVDSIDDAHALAGRAVLLTLNGRKVSFPLDEIKKALEEYLAGSRERTEPLFRPLEAEAVAYAASRSIGISELLMRPEAKALPLYFREELSLSIIAQWGKAWERAPNQVKQDLSNFVAGSRVTEVRDDLDKLVARIKLHEDGMDYDAHVNEARAIDRVLARVNLLFASEPVFIEGCAPALQGVAEQVRELATLVNPDWIATPEQTLEAIRESPAPMDALELPATPRT
jgi:hypothetical protein